VDWEAAKAEAERFHLLSDLRRRFSLRFPA
jgi:hypothetical protein